MKFGRREIGEIVRWLPDKKKQKILPGSPAVSTVQIVQNLPGPAPNNVLRVLQILSKSVHFQWSYIQTLEHRQNTPYSK